MTIIIRSVFEEEGKFYPQVFLDEALYELSIWKILEYDRIDISEQIDINKGKCIKRMWYLSLLLF